MSTTTSGRKASKSSSVRERQAALIMRELSLMLGRFAIISRDCRYQGDLRILGKRGRREIVDHDLGHPTALDDSGPWYEYRIRWYRRTKKAKPSEDVEC